MRVAIIHPWFLARGGGERTVEVMAEMFPQADIFTVLADRRTLPSGLKDRRIVTSGWNWIPAKYSIYRYLLPFYPLAFEALDLRGYDLVLSSDSCLSKGVLLDDETTHVCYCHSPMRCLYDQYRQTIAELPWFGRPVFRFAAHYLRIWDYAAAHRATGIAANSRYISRRVRTYYGLDSKVVYPPVETQHGYLDSRTDDYYLCAGRLVKTKRIEIAIQACNALRRRLIVVGCGRELAYLKKIAGPTIEFTEWASPEQLTALYAQCRALLFAAREDFGMVPVECQSYGRPVIAYGRGGSLETVIHGTTGLHFDKQTSESLVQAMLQFESMESSFDPVTIRAHAQSFDISGFKRRLYDFVDLCIEAKRQGRSWGEVAQDAFPNVKLEGVPVHPGVLDDLEPFILNSPSAS